MPRGLQREHAILTATLELVGEHGYAALTMDAVATRARASKATIYRRWRNKAELVRAALDRLDAADNTAIADTGALRSDLYAVMEAMQRKASAAYMDLIQGLIAASRHDPELAAALQSHVQDEELSPFREALLRALARGDLSPGTDIALVHDVAESLILRQLQVGAPFDAAFITRVVDGALLPMLGHKPS